MLQDVFTRDDLERLNYQQLVQLAKKYNVYNRKQAKKISLLKKLVGLRKNEDDLVQEKENMEPEISRDFSDHIKNNESLLEKKEMSPDMEDRRSTFTIQAGENLVNKYVPIPEEGNKGRRLTFTKSTSANLVKKYKPLPEEENEERRLTFTKPTSASKKGLLRKANEIIVMSPKQSSNGNSSPVRKNLEKKPTFFSPPRTPATPSVKLPKAPATVHKCSTQKKASAARTPVSVQKVPFLLSKSGRKPGTMPDFKAIHAKQFSKMESLVQHKERVSKRAIQLLSPVSLKKKSSIPVSMTTLKAKPIDTMKLTGKKVSGIPVPARKDHFNKMVNSMAPSTTTDKTREKNRAIINGIRSNRRFELQLQMRKHASNNI